MKAASLPPKDPEAKAGVVGIVSSLEMPHKRSRFGFLRRPRAVVILTTLVCLAFFFAGYQLAFTQLTNNDSLLPHFGGDNPYSSQCTDESLLNSCQDDNRNCLNCSVEDEPVIYLYPQQTESVTVHEQYATGLAKTIPTYNSITGWQVLAHSNGQLTNSTNNKMYPYLFWESKLGAQHYDMTTGFVVAGSDTNTFLQTELATIGLTPSEARTFIDYWLPKMEHNKYNLIHFAGNDYTDYSKLTISPKPDSLLRVNMAFKPLDQPVAVTPQTFAPFVRHGFTVVEWGGAQLQ